MHLDRGASRECDLGAVGSLSPSFARPGRLERTRPMNFFVGIDIVDSRAVCPFVDGKNLPRMNQSINPLSIVLFPSIVAKTVDSRKVSLP